MGRKKLKIGNMIVSGTDLYYGVPQDFTGHVVKKDQSGRAWFKNGLLHRKDGPAVVDFCGIQKLWYQNGQLHRENGPAVIDIGTSKESWYLDGYRAAVQSLSEFREWSKYHKKTIGIVNKIHRIIEQDLFYDFRMMATEKESRDRVVSAIKDIIANEGIPASALSGVELVELKKNSVTLNSLHIKNAIQHYLKSKAKLLD